MNTRNFESIEDSLPQRIIKGLLDASESLDVTAEDAWIERVTRGVSMCVKVRDSVTNMCEILEVTESGYRVGGRLAKTYREAMWFAQLAIETRDINQAA